MEKETDKRIIEFKERRITEEFLKELRKVLNGTGKGFVTIYIDDYTATDIIHQQKRKVL